MFDQLSINDLVSMASAQPVSALGDEDHLFHRIQAGDPDAVEELVLGNLRIAIDESIRTRGLGLPQRELVRIGVRALVEAVQSYDPGEDGPFANYARSSVRKVLIRSIGVS